MKIYVVYCVVNNRWYAEQAASAKIRQKFTPISVLSSDLDRYGCCVWTAATKLSKLIDFFEFQFSKDCEPFPEEVRRIINKKKMTDDEKIDRLNDILYEKAYITWAEEGEEL